MQGTCVWSLGGENLLEKEMATHSSILAWEIPWTEKPGGLPFMGSQRAGHNGYDLMTKQNNQWLGLQVFTPEGWSWGTKISQPWELDFKENWAQKNWCFWTVVLEKTLESPLDCKEIQPVHLKGDQFWVFTGGTDVEAETSNILATWCEELTHLKRPWCWGRLRAGGEGGDRGWDG